MSENLTEKQTRNLRIIIAWINTKINEGLNKEEIIGYLQDNGFQLDIANNLYETVRETRKKEARKKRKYLKQLQREKEAAEGWDRMVKGGLIFGLGVVITVVTYQSAGPGEHYVLCYGAIIFGALGAIAGFIQWTSNK